MMMVQRYTHYSFFDGKALHYLANRSYVLVHFPSSLTLMTSIIFPKRKVYGMKLHIYLHQADAVHSNKQCYVTSGSGSSRRFMHLMNTQHLFEI